MSRKTPRKKPRRRERERALVADDPLLMTVLGLRAWLPQVMSDATFKLLFACGFVVASIFAWRYVPTPAVPFLTLFAVTLGALLGTPIDDSMRRRRATLRDASSREGREKERR